MAPMAPQQGMDESLSQAVGTSAEMYLRKGKKSCKEAMREQKECNTAEGRPRSEKEEKVLLHMPDLTSTTLPSMDDPTPEQVGIS